MKKKETRRHHVKQPRITAVIDELADELKKKKKGECLLSKKIIQIASTARKKNV